MRARKIFFLTPNGYKKIKNECERLKKKKNAKIKGDVPASFESDAVSSDYLFFLEELDLLNKKISELEEVIRNSKVISAPPKRQNIIQIGAKIILEGKKGLRKIMLVGTAESDPSQGKISTDSPFGKSLLGRKVGDRMEDYKIKKIAYE